MNVLSRLRRDRRGTMAIEFAFIFPLVLMLTVGAIELALIMLLDASLEMGVAEASRSGSLTAFGTSAEREARVKRIVDTMVSRWVPGTNNIEVRTFVYPVLATFGSRTWIDSDGNKQCDPGEGTCPPLGVQLTPGIGTQGALVLYTVTVRRSGFSGIFKLAGVDTLEFRRQAIVLNE